MCLRSRGGEVSVRRYHTDVPYVVPTPRHDENLFDKQWELNDGRLSCRFSRDMKVYTEGSVDLNNNWYQLYAWGAISECQYN